MSGGGNTRPQGTEVGPKIQAHLPPPVCEIPEVCTQLPAVWAPVMGLTGVSLAGCTGGQSSILSLPDTGALTPHAQCKLWQRDLTHRNLRADRSMDSPGVLSILSALTWFPACW